MSKRTRITDDIIDKVWMLHNLGYSKEYISANLEISNLSTQRCIVAMTTAQQGKFVEYKGILKDTHHIADYANKRFNIKSIDQIIEDNRELELYTAINRLADVIEKQNNLIEGFMNKFK